MTNIEWEMPNLVGYLTTAAESNIMRGQAATMMAHRLLAENMQTNQDRAGLRISDTGGCGRELWAKERKLIDIPFDTIDMQLSRFDFGTYTGMWVGALIAVAARADGWYAALEEDVLVCGVPGHIDVRLYRSMFTTLEVLNGTGPSVYRSHVVEIKSTYEPAPIKDPIAQAPYQVMQASGYSNCDNEEQRSQTFSIVTVGPCVTKKERVKQWHYVAADHAHTVAFDLDRLAKAIASDEMPAADPPEKWRCFTCGFSACKKNKNKGADAAELLFA